jgi:hypothetical protein
MLMNVSCFWMTGNCRSWVFGLFIYPSVLQSSMCTPRSLSLYLASIISQRSLLKIPVLESLLLLVRETSFIFKMFITKGWCCTSVLDQRPKFYGRNRRFKTYTYGYDGQSLRPFLRPKVLFVVPSFPADSTLSEGQSQIIPCLVALEL